MMLFCVVGLAFSQRTISGMVSDDQGEALIGANILVKGTTIGTVTDIDGKYTLSVPADAGNTLVFSYTGYTTRDVIIGESNIVDLMMSEGVTLNNVVVTAIGISREDKALGYAVQEVGGAEIAEANTVSMIDALSGKAAGVMVNSSSGAAGASSRIVLRGQTSFNGNNQPLLVVDGVRVNNSESHSERSLGGVAVSNRGMDINPNDIENVTILKGAGATALYGVEGARGVIVITTKKGQAGDKVKVELSSNVTLQTITNMVGLQNQFSQGSGGQWSGPGTSFFPNAVSWGANLDTLYYDGSDYKWDKNGQIVGESSPDRGAKVTPYDNVGDFFKTGYILNNNISVSGGTDKLGYRISGSHLHQSGVTPNNEFSRTNFGISTTSKLDKFSISSNLNFAKSGGLRIQQGSNVSGVMLGLLRTPSTFDNSNGFGADGADNSEAYQFPDNSQRNYRAGGGYDNPFWIVNNTPFRDNVYRMFGSVNVGYEFHPWAKVGATIGTDFYTDNRQQKFEIGSRAQPGGQIIEDQINYRHFDTYFNLSGNGSLTPDFSLSYNVGMNVYDSSSKSNGIIGNGISFPGFVHVGNAANISSTIGNSNTKTVGLYGVLDIGYKNFAYLTFTGRNDWLSSLIAPTRAFNSSDISVFYPSVSGSLILSEMFKIPSTSALSFAKLRFSFAQVGGGAPGPYSTSTIFTAPAANGGTINDVNDGWTNGIGFPYDGRTGFTYSALTGSDVLQPSKTRDYEFGTDLRFFNGRVGVEATYYSRNSGNQIIAINVSNSTGFQRAFVNSGELGTNGGEIVLNLSPIQRKDFSWDIGFNFSKWKTVVKSLPEGVPNQYLDGFTGTGVYNFAPETDENGNVTREFEFGQIYGGAWQRTNDVNAAGTPIYNGELPYNPDGEVVIDNTGSSDPSSPFYNPNYGYPEQATGNQIIGNPNPDFLLGINNSINFKGVRLDFLIDIKHGGDMWNGTKGAATFFGRTDITEDRVQLLPNGASDYSNGNYIFDGVYATGEPNQIVAPLDQNWFTGNGGGFGNVAEHFIEDASYYRLRYVTLGYDLTRDLIPGLPFSKIGLSVTGRNLIILTPYTGVDPETSLVGSSSNGQGLDYFQMPGVQSYSFGLNITF